MKNIFISICFVLALFMSSCISQKCTTICKSPKLSLEEKQVLRIKRNQQLGKIYVYSISGFMIILGCQIYVHESNNL